MNKRFNIVNESKFNTLSNSEMQSVKGGGICLSCQKRERNVPIRIGTVTNKDVPLKGGIQTQP